MVHAEDLIRRKRDGEELSSADLRELVLAYVREEVPDYQLAAFCMAVYFRGLSSSETFALTEAHLILTTLRAFPNCKKSGSGADLLDKACSLLQKISSSCRHS